MRLRLIDKGCAIQVTATIDGVVVSLVADTATGTRPVPLGEWVADQGGVRAIELKTEGGGRANDLHG